MYSVYLCLGLLAVAPIVAASYMAPPVIGGKTPKKSAAAEVLGELDAYTFPIYGSIMLFSLFLILKYVPKEWSVLAMKAYFTLMGVFLTVDTLRDVMIGGLARIGIKVPDYEAISQQAEGAAPALDGSLFGRLTRPYHLRLSRFGSSEYLFELDFDIFHLLSMAITLPLNVAFLMTGNWIVNNILALLFSYRALCSMRIDTFRTGFILLVGLFFYDIFWVFATPVMVHVAKNIDAPVKLVWPSVGADGAVRFSMLGLGDIIIPGIFIVLTMSFDLFLKKKRILADLKRKSPDVQNPSLPTISVWTHGANVYFRSAMLAYCLGLVATVVVMIFFKSAQPALLYLSPACIAAVAIPAFLRGEFKDVLSFNSSSLEEDEPTPEATGAAAVTADADKTD
ncbi:hypothetical protein H696_03871 [Fonticula alba]|uniref:Minor histocompatibility antigen H13 n=1 Tax=Fonticula alba TaxID=691883 RepID=A0A058Z7F1_FONAL|nr:hypothetical protein H696_03871 [Fonticula alba]KCV69442.1 hypothetical protein H696_03871 [Fonticula alba]|eukprot:XP_009496007.1 hypothetical protein H696_03871 [Fonticula alba]